MRRSLSGAGCHARCRKVSTYRLGVPPNTTHAAVNTLVEEAAVDALKRSDVGSQADLLCITCTALQPLQARNRKLQQHSGLDQKYREGAYGVEEAVEAPIRPSSVEDAQKSVAVTAHWSQLASSRT